MTKSKIKVAVGMSGGVDSSVTAARLLDQGFEVIGITLDLLPPWVAPQKENTAVIDARKVAAELGIEHVVLPLSDLFESKVIEPFAAEYTRGRTPNPCVFCNVAIKFGAMLDFARRQGCQYLATGHYARLVDIEGQRFIARPRDTRKDQTYFLWHVDPALYKYLMFPLSEHEKRQTFDDAQDRGMFVAQKAESQDICFTCAMSQREIVEHIYPDACKPGPIIDDEGTVRGQHSGLYGYTIGQRKGLGVGGLEKPYYVYDIDEKTNTVFIGPKEKLAVTHVHATEAHLINVGFGEEVKCQVMLRYNMKPLDALVKYSSEGEIDITLSEPAFGIARGQSAVCYQERDGHSIVIGGGIISCVS